MVTPDPATVSTGDYSLYIVRCANGSLYTGIATDVRRRIRQHEEGPQGARYLRGKGPLSLEFEQLVGNRSVAQRVELRVKRLDRQGKEALISGRISVSELAGDAGCGDSQASGDACG